MSKQVQYIFNSCRNNLNINRLALFRRNVHIYYRMKYKDSKELRLILLVTSMLLIYLIFLGLYLLSSILSKYQVIMIGLMGIGILLITFLYKINLLYIIFGIRRYSFTELIKENNFNKG